MALRRWSHNEMRRLARLVCRQHTNKQIAALLGRTTVQVEDKIKRMGLTGQRRQRNKVQGQRPRLDETSRMVLGEEASKRRMNLLDLENRLLETIARDGLVGAILDDAREAAE